MNNLNLPNPKMMDIAVPGNLSLGISLEKQKLSNGLEKKDFKLPFLLYKIYKSRS